MGETLRLTAPLEKRGPAGAFLLTDEQVVALGDGRKTFPVTVTVNGGAFALRLARMGGENLIGLSKAVRAAARVELEESYDIEIAVDAVERTVEVPQDLAAALAADGPAQAGFGALAYSHRKEYVRWVTEAKRPQTRAERVAKAVEMVREGKTR
jgi:hypothetical protein